MKLNKKLNISSLLYYLAFFLLIFQSMTRWVTIKNFSLLSSLCSISIPPVLLLVFIIKNQKITKKNLLIIIILIILTIISMTISKGNAIWNIILFIISSKNIDTNNIIKFDFITKIILMVFIYILYKNGLTENIVIYRNDVFRYGLGFGHPNTFSVYLMGICLDFLYLTFKTKYKKFSYILIILGISIISIYCDSRSSMYTLAIALILSLIMKLIKNNKCIINFLSKLPIVFMLLSFFATIAYKYRNSFNFIYKLNEILSNRIALMYQFYEKYSITLFGNYFINYHTQSTSTASVLDNTYILLLTKFGVLITIMIIWTMYKRIKKAFEEENFGLAICLISFTFFGLMENGMIVLFYNPFLLSLADFIFKKGESNENE